MTYWKVLVCSCLALSLAFGCAEQGGRARTDGSVGHDGGGSDGGGSDGGVTTDARADAGAGEDAAACMVASDEAVSAPVDVIIAIDGSPSMGEELAAVISNLNTHLLDILSASSIDWRLVFISAATGLPTGPEIFQANHFVNSSDALTLILWTYDGQGRSPNTCTATSHPELTWRTFLRFEAIKVFIAVTDDDPSTFNCPGATQYCNDMGWDCSGCASDCASGYCPMWQCPTYADQTADWGGGTFPEELYALAPTGMFGVASSPKWIFHAIVPVATPLGPADPVTGLGDVCNDNGNTGETTGVEYQKLAVLTGGLRFPSCDTDYSPVFQSIAQTIVPLACTYLLESTNLGMPDPSHTNVVFDPGDGSPPEIIPQDATAPCDGGADGWQWNADHSAILLCGPACDQVRSSTTGHVTITVGCDTLVRQ